MSHLRDIGWARRRGDSYSKPQDKAPSHEAGEVEASCLHDSPNDDGQGSYEHSNASTYNSQVNENLVRELVDIPNVSVAGPAAKEPARFPIV